MYLRRRLIPLVLSVLLLATILSACAPDGAQTAPVQTEILSQKLTPQGRIPVTVLVKYAFTINAFEKAAEERFPNLDIIQVGNYTSGRGLVEYERRLKNDDLTDIVMTWPLEIGEEYWAERFIDLSGMPFTSNYSNGMLDSLSRGGALYYLPGPAQVRGIVYNKTLFQEKGWAVPNNFEEFVALCQEIEASGIRALQLGFANPEVLDTAFVGYSYSDCYSTPQDAKWITDYNNGTGSFGEHFMPALDTFQTLIDAGIWRASDLEVDYSQRENMLFFDRQCAMVEDSVLLARLVGQQTGTTDEFALMPFFSPGGVDNDWARLYMVCYIGLNKHLQEEKNQEKYELVLELMEYISSPDGQEALSADTGAMYSSVKNVPSPSIQEIQALIPALNHGRYAIFPELKNAQDALRQGLAGMLRGELNKDDVVRMVDDQNRNPSGKDGDTEVGTASEEFSLIETGNFITDVMRAETGADFALFLDNGKDGRYNGLGVSGRFYAGVQTKADVLRVLPDLKYGVAGTLHVVTMTGAELRETLEHALPVENNAIGWFYYFSGLRMEYAPAAERGSRLGKLTDEAGVAIDPARQYTIAVMDSSYPEERVSSVEDTGILIRDLVQEAISKAGTITPSGDGRFTVTQPQ